MLRKFRGRRRVRWTRLSRETRDALTAKVTELVVFSLIHHLLIISSEAPKE